MTIPRHSPMLAVPWRDPFSDPGWTFEVKWDGVRVALGWDGATVSARSRNGNDLLAAFPELESFRWPRPGLIDAELVTFDERGVPSFERLQQRLGASGLRARELARSIPVSVVAFDVVFDGRPVLDEPLEDRFARLESVEPGLVVVSERTDRDGDALFEAVQAASLEGMVAKRLGSQYRPGVRSPDWRKVAVADRLRAIVGGFLPGEGGRSATFGSLLLGLNDGDSLRYIGRVGSGFDERTLAAIRTSLDELRSEVCPFAGDVDPSGATWVEPGMVVRVSFKNWTAAGRLRAPVFDGLDLVDSASVTWEAEGPSQGSVE